ncbi:MAG: extracellular solute-binding protein [Puniceicoccaceae bacterium]|nr:MAG: extracellular solute-binding protein [Puniceicoccaceae bacterium]
MTGNLKDRLAKGFILGSLAVILIVPFALRPEVEEGAGQDTLVIISPHNEAIRHEFGQAFRAWYREQTGRTVRMDWRVLGGTSEINRFVESEYFNGFRLHWTRTLGRPWDERVIAAMFDHRIELPADPALDTIEQAARRAFLASEVGIGLDLFFGGGSFDLARHARSGFLVPSRIYETHPEWFADDIFPETFRGEPYRDPAGRWIGTVLSSFGILYNYDSLRRLGIEQPPRQWVDLTDPRFFRELALADPTKSGSITKAFEMVIQQEMRRLYEEGLEEGLAAAEAEERAVRAGWLNGIGIIQLMGANARYFTDSASKPNIDVAQGDSAAGLCIDFYGRYQAEVVQRRDDSSRLRFITPPGGSVFSADPIGLMRGAPNPEVAERFIEFVLSKQGQALWNLRPGTPGGSQRFALRRQPIRMDVYTEENRRHFSDPEVDPFSDEDPFYYRSDWTGPLFRQIGFVVRMVCLDPFDELVRAWRAIIEAGMPEEALAVLTDLSRVDLEETRGTISQAVRSANPLDEIRLARDLNRHFRQQYREAERIAREAERQRRTGATLQGPAREG